VPPDHFYRHLERRLDLSFVRDLVRDRYAPTGRPSVDPDVVELAPPDVRRARPNSPAQRLLEWHLATAPPTGPAAMGTILTAADLSIPPV